MPPKPNGFFMFMKDEQKRLRGLTNRAPHMNDMAALCRDAWKNLSPAQKAVYDNKARQEKVRLQGGGDRMYAKLDCYQQVISERKDPASEDRKRRNQDKQSIQNGFAHKDTRDRVFHLIDFQVMYDDRGEDHYPLEIGMVSFSLRKGIINFMHRFIDPGEVPQGNRHLAMSYSENTHKIPLNFEHADPNLKALSTHMVEFLKSDRQSDEMPSIFCLSIHRQLVENCLDFIYSKVYQSETERIQLVYCLEDLVSCLIANTGKSEKPVAESQIHDMLIQNRWDYNSSIRCFFHEELDCANCSLSVVRRYSFALFDMLSTLLEFDLTNKHMPDEVEENFLVTDVGSFGFGQQKFHSGNDDRHKRFQNYRGDEQSFNTTNSSNTQNIRPAWQPPTVQPVKVPLHNENEEEDEEEEEASSKATEYSYRKLRLPKSLAQVQTQVDQLSLGKENQTTSSPSLVSQQVPVNPMVNPATPFNRAPMSAPLIPRGRGMAPGRPQMRPRGLNAPRPPPGFEPKPTWPGVGAPVFRQPLHRPSEQHFPPLGRGS